MVQFGCKGLDAVLKLREFIKASHIIIQRTIFLRIRTREVIPTPPLTARSSRTIEDNIRNLPLVNPSDCTIHQIHNPKLPVPSSDVLYCISICYITRWNVNTYSRVWVYDVQCTVYGVKCTSSCVYGTMYIVQCTL